MFRLESLRRNNVSLVSSQLYNELSFYPAFVHDLRGSTGSIIIESPFISYRRFSKLYPVLEAAIRRGVTIIINTRDPVGHDGIMKEHAVNAVSTLQELGATVLYTSNLHRKVAIIDRAVLWEGSLNILSQSDSCEMMRRTESVVAARQMIRFTGLDRWYTT
jgi:hypothetical protein